MIRLGLATAAVLSLLVTGCGGSSKTKTVTVPPPSAAGTTPPTVTTPGATTAPSGATAAAPYRLKFLEARAQNVKAVNKANKAVGKAKNSIPKVIKALSGAKRAVKLSADKLSRVTPPPQAAAAAKRYIAALRAEQRHFTTQINAARARNVSKYNRGAHVFRQIVRTVNRSERALSKALG